MPPLPKQLKKREAEWITKVFRPWLMKHKWTGAFEVKDTRGKPYLFFSEIKTHQLASLTRVRYDSFVYKIPDMGGKNPFDVIALYEQPSYVVIHYPQGFVLIEPDMIEREQKRSKRKSLTWERAQAIATVVE